MSRIQVKKTSFIFGLFLTIFSFSILFAGNLNSNSNSESGRFWGRSCSSSTDYNGCQAITTTVCTYYVLWFAADTDVIVDIDNSGCW